MINCVSLRVAGRIPIMEVVSTQLDAQEVEVERAKKAWKLVPRYVSINEVENLDKEALKESWLEIGWLHCFRVWRALHKIIWKNQLQVRLEEEQVWSRDYQ
jgi:hypothetical protein